MSKVEEFCISCQSCGATLDVPAGLRTVECPYCDSPSIIERPASPERPRPRFVIGFTLTQPEARARVQAWIKRRGLFVPSKVKQATVEKTRGVYLPAYLYSATSHSDYSAEIGEHYTVTESYTTTDSNGRTVTRTRTRTETEWRHLSGQHACYVQDLLVSASQQIANLELEAIEPYDLRTLQRYSAALVSGWPAEEASRSREECLLFAHGEGEQQLDRELAAFLPGDRQSGLTTKSTFEHQSIELTLLPVWVFTARYAKDKAPLRILVNGQTGEVQGEVPLSYSKIAMAVILGLFLLVGAVVGVLLLTQGGRGW